MLNLYSQVLSYPGYFRQLKCGDSLISMYNCPLENKHEDVWSRFNYIVYVIEGRKIWHTAHGSYDLQKGKCVLVRKGACIVEQFFDTAFCLVIFFIPDDFIRDVLQSKKTPIRQPGKKFDPVIPIDTSPAIHAFYQSMLPHFDAGREPDPSLLELKFREIVLTIAENPANIELLSYFSSLLQEPATVSIQQIMEENFQYNLKLEEFAQLCMRSLSAYKRDFHRIYKTTPGKWLLEKRLDHAMHLLKHLGRTVSETAFESGFENPSHFSRAFRQHFGVTPASLKQQTTV